MSRKSEGTYTDYQDLLERARTYLGDDLTVGEVRKFHPAKLEQGMHDGYSPTSVYKTIHAVQRVFAWAVEVQILDYSPLVGYRKPRPRQRTRIITPAEFRRMLRHSDAVFRRALLALRLTGCRPGELRAPRWDPVDLGGGIWVLPEHKTVTRQRDPRPRVIALPEPILRLVRWLAREPHGPQDPVFCSREGRPWTREAFHSRMTRLRERAGLEPLGGERLVLYSARHRVRDPERVREALDSYAREGLEIKLQEEGSGWTLEMAYRDEDWESWDLPAALSINDLPREDQYPDEDAYFEAEGKDYRERGDQGFLTLLRELAPHLESPLLIVAVAASPIDEFEYAARVTVDQSQKART
jgi:integrase